MKKFMDENFLLQTETAQRLYHDHAKKMPIIDYHCHLSAREIAEDMQYDNLGEIWLGGDHYKWRAMRIIRPSLIRRAMVVRLISDAIRHYKNKSNPPERRKGRVLNLRKTALDIENQATVCFSSPHCRSLEFNFSFEFLFLREKLFNGFRKLIIFTRGFMHGLCT